MLEGLGRALIYLSFITVPAAAYLAPGFLMYSMAPVVVGLLLIIISRFKQQS
jgi:hypothetical protein